MELERIKFFSEMSHWCFELYRNDKDTTHKCEYYYKKMKKHPLYSALRHLHSMQLHQSDKGFPRKNLFFSCNIGLLCIFAFVFYS